jgi:flagellar protein FlaJ
MSGGPEDGTDPDDHASDDGEYSDGETSLGDAPFRGEGIDEETAEAVLADALDDPVSVSLGTREDGKGEGDEDDERETGDSGGILDGVDGFLGEEGIGFGSEGYGEGGHDEADLEPEPEAALGQRTPEGETGRRADVAELRAAYGWVRAFFKTRPERYTALQRRLKQARIGVTYDEYLVTSVRVAAVAAVAGAVLGVVLLAVWPALVALGAGAEAAGTTALSMPSLLPGFAATLAGGGVGAVTAWVGRNYYLPRRTIAARRREIALTLPYAITYTYALSNGGMNFADVCRRLAAADAVYGEVSNEFDVVVREMDLFGNDLPQALSNVRGLTPSETLQRFLDDLLSVLESGGDLESFLESESREYLDEALDEQTSFIETLGTLSEVFVVAFVATPLFLLVVMLVVSSLGSSTVRETTLLVYLVFPLAMVFFLILVDLLSAPYEQPAVVREAAGNTGSLGELTDDERYERYEHASRRQRLRKLVGRPLATMGRRPTASLAITVPVGIAVAGLAVATDTVEPTIGAVLDSPVATTVGLAVTPLLVATVPLAVLHERERRRRLVLVERFPDVLSILASANRMGIAVVDGFDLVVRWTTGTLATELRTVRNDLAWNHDLPAALVGFAGRIRVPELTRTVRLVADGSQASGDLHELLEVAAADTRARAKLRRARRRAVSSYVAIVVLGFLVYLLVVTLLSRSYLAPLEALPELPETSATTGAPLGAEVPVDAFEVLFFHSALVQGFGTGLLAGKLAENDLKSGLKYGIGLVVITVATFALLV